MMVEVGGTSIVATELYWQGWVGLVPPKKCAGLAQKDLLLSICFLCECVLRKMYRVAC